MCVCVCVCVVQLRGSRVRVLARALFYLWLRRGGLNRNIAKLGYLRENGRWGLNAFKR